MHVKPWQVPRMCVPDSNPLYACTPLFMVIVSVIGSALAHARPKRLDPPPPVTPALASWYDDSGSTASGRHYGDGFASLLFGDRWGTAVRFCYRGRCATGYLDDHGPYVTGRTFDLNPTLHAALGCPDLCWLTWQRAIFYAPSNNSGPGAGER